MLPVIAGIARAGSGAVKKLRPKNKGQKQSHSNTNSRPKPRLSLVPKDAEAVRRNIVEGKQNNNPQSNPLHPDTASEFSERYGGSLYQEENNNPRPTNVLVERKENNDTQKKRRGVRFLQREQRVEGGQASNSGLFRRDRVNASNKSSSSKEGIGKKSVLEKSLDVYGKTAGRGLMTTAHAWTLFIYFTFQIWLGIIAVIAIAIVFAIEYYVGSGTTELAFDTFMAAIGVEWDFYLVALLFYMMVLVVCYIQLLGVAIQAKALGLHPLGGRGAFFKTGTFLLCFILYWVPIINCLPLTNLYILSIQAYPR